MVSEEEGKLKEVWLQIRRDIYREKRKRRNIRGKKKIT